jgi:hypothetical protein
VRLSYRALAAASLVGAAGFLQSGQAVTRPYERNIERTGEEVQKLTGSLRGVPSEFP